ncbi:hypothetical protein V6N13_131838 [Hibiscus sabdariffa]
MPSIVAWGKWPHHTEADKVEWCAPMDLQNLSLKSHQIQQGKYFDFGFGVNILPHTVDIVHDDDDESIREKNEFQVIEFWLVLIPDLPSVTTKLGGMKPGPKSFKTHVRFIRMTSNQTTFPATLCVINSQRRKRRNQVVTKVKRKAVENLDKQMIDAIYCKAKLG